MWRIVYPILLVSASLALALLYPMLLVLFIAGAIVLFSLSRNLNLYKIVMVLKRYARNLGAKLRCDIRARLHLGFRDYNGNISANADEELHHRTHGYKR
jgi:hypothetical protein